MLSRSSSCAANTMVPERSAYGFLVNALTHAGTFHLRGRCPSQNLPTLDGSAGWPRTESAERFGTPGRAQGAASGRARGVRAQE